jgi:hypothetical protein
MARLICLERSHILILKILPETDDANNATVKVFGRSWAFCFQYVEILVEVGAQRIPTHLHQLGPCQEEAGPRALEIQYAQVLTGTTSFIFAASTTLLTTHTRPAIILSLGVSLPILL